MGKVERMRSRPPDAQEGSEEQGGGKASWADSIDHRAPSPRSTGHFGKAAALPDYQGGSRTISGSVARGKPPASADEESEAWRQKRKKSSEISEAVERARRRREEEERRMEEQRLAACAEKLKRLNEKHRQSTEAQASLPQTTSEIVAPQEEAPSCPEPTSSPAVLQPQASVVQTLVPERVDQDEERIKLEQAEPKPEEEEEKEEEPLPQRPSSPVQWPVVSAPDPPIEGENTLAEVEPLVDENQAERTTVPIRDYFTMEDNRVDETHLSLPHTDPPSSEDTAVAPTQLEGEAAAAMRPSLTSGYSKQFQKSLPPRFLRQQEQMKQQQWQQQQQQSGGSVSPSGSGGVPSTQQQQQHRSMYQSIGPHHQHLASMGFDPRWIMMQSYMDPRMMSARPPIDMPTNIHGRIPPKQMARREPGDNSSSSSDSFDHLTRSIRDHGLPSDSRMVWGSDPYPPSEPLPSVTPPKGRDDTKEPRIDSGLDLERGLPPMYPQEHSALDSRKSNFFRDPPEPISVFSQSPDDMPGPMDRVPVTSGFDRDESGLPSGEEVEALGKAMLQRSVSQGSRHSLKLDEPRFDGLPLGSKALELQDTVDRADDKSQNELFTPAGITNSRATPPSDGLHKPEKLPLPILSKQKVELRWGGRPGRREGLGGERPLRRSGPIKKPVLRDMKEEREQREEREKRHERGERGDRTKKDQSSKAPLVPPAASAAPAAASEVSRAQGEGKREVADVEETHISLPKARESLTSSGVPTSSSQEDKADKLPTNDKHVEPKLPARKESNIALRNYRREERERDRERDKEMDRDREWPVDANFKGRGRGEYYSRGRSFRGTYSGRGRGGRGRSRDYPHREPRSRSDLPSGAAAFRNREESETRSESSDFEVIPKRRRRRGSDTDSESEGGRESASDTGPSDREPSSKPSRPLRRELPSEARSSLHRPGFGPPHMVDKVGSRFDDEGRPKPGFLPKGEPSRRGRGGLYSRRGGARERGGPRSVPLRRPAAREPSSQWPSKPMETFRPEDMESTSRYDHPSDRRPPRSDCKKFLDGCPQSSRERPRRSRPARPPRQDKPPRFRRLKEREAAVLPSGDPGPSPPVSLPPVPTSASAPAAISAPVSVSPTLSRAPGTPVTVPAEAPANTPAHNHPAPHDGAFSETSDPTAVSAVGTKSPDLSNQNSSDQANEEWETASESSDFNERREREERRGAQEAASNPVATPAPAPPQRSLTPSKTPPEGVVSPKRDGVAVSKRSFSSQRPIERQNRRGNSGAKPGRSYCGPKGDRRGGAKGGRKGPGAQQNSDSTALPSGSSRSAKDQAARRKDEAKLAVKKPKENALSQFDLNNYASVVIIDDHPEVTTTDDPQSSTNDDGFTEVVSRKQQKRLQDEEKRKKEEQTTQVVGQNWGKKGSSEKSRGGGGKLPPRFAKKQSSQQQHQGSSQSQPPAPASTPQVQPQPATSAPQHPHLPPAQPAAPPQPLEGTVPSVPAATVDFTSKSVAPVTATAQSHGNLGTELWEKKVAGPAVLPDVKKLGPISPPQPPSVSAWNKPLTSFTGTVSSEGGKPAAENSVELAIDSIQFGAPSSAGSTDSDGVPAVLEPTTDNKLPAPKEQRQKQPRAGPIKTQKLPDMEPVETKEYKPGPIGKERSLKNRKAKDARGGEGEGREPGVPGGSTVNRAAASSPPTSDAAVTELGGDIEGMITVPSAEYTSNSKESVTDYTTPSSSLADSVPSGNNKMEESLVANVALPHSLPLPRRETLQQSSPLSTVSPATVDLTLKMESARKAWENSPSLEKNSPVTSSSSPITSCASSYSFSSASMPQIPVASVTPSTSLSVHHAGSGTYTTSSLGTKTTTASDPPNICKVKPQQLQGGSLTSSGSSGGSSFSQLGCMPPLLPQQQTPQVYVSQSAAGSAAQIPAFYMDTSHLFSTPHPRLAPPSLAQQQGFQPGLSQPTAVQQIPIPIYAPLQGQPQHQHTHQAQLGLGAGPPVSQPQDLFSSSLQYRSQQAFMQSSLSQPSMMLSGPSMHSYPGVQAPDMGKPQSSLAYQQPSSTQHIPILFEPQLNQPSGMGGSQLIDTHLLQARQGMNQHSNIYSGQVQQHGQSSYYSNTQSPSSGMQQVTVPLPGSQLSLANFGSGGGQPLLAMPPTPPQAQPPNIGRQPPISQPYRGLMGPSHSHSMMQPPTSKMDMDLKLFGGGMDVKPVTPPVSARSTTPTSSPYRASSTSPSSQSAKLNSMLYQKQFQPNSGSMRMTQHFPGQFNPQLLSQANMVSPLVRAPHANSFGGGAGMQRSPMGPPMTPNMGGGLMPHPRPQHPQHGQHLQHPPPRGPGGPPMPPRGTQAALKAEQDLKAKQRAEVLQSTHKFFSEQQQLSKALKPPPQLLDAAPAQMPQLPPPNPDADKPPQISSSSLSSAKPVRTGPIKPQAIKPEEGK
ncbi:protein PRRC2C isoform X1 [Syngnathoides biaculeatus]|uniref:protein PRRC2C isoform X1 n=1 Tax=Syngnathoides biaculeatus TaxID=300417 RepID=UPI002ADD76ED|nr:protein PRRC2C isoform X1 [Syngnathoides biaculeatus]